MTGQGWLWVGAGAAVSAAALVAAIAAVRGAGAGQAPAAWALLALVLLPRHASGIKRWAWLGLLGIFLILDMLLFSANALKILEGGWLPLLVGAGSIVGASRCFWSARSTRTTPPETALQPHAGARLRGWSSGCAISEHAHCPCRRHTAA